MPSNQAKDTSGDFLAAQGMLLYLKMRSIWKWPLLCCKEDTDVRHAMAENHPPGLGSCRSPNGHHSLCSEFLMPVHGFAFPGSRTHWMDASCPHGLFQLCVGALERRHGSGRWMVPSGQSPCADLLPSCSMSPFCNICNNHLPSKCTLS